MDTMQLALAGIALTMAVALQGAIGFGAGLLAVPLLVWVGIDLPVAVAALMAAVTFQVALNSWRYRDHIPWRTTLAMCFWRVLSLPVGVAILWLLADAGRARAKQAVGAVLLAVLLTQYLAKVRPRQCVHPAWMALAGITSGMLAGAIGMGGPPVVLWMMAHDWPAKRYRAFLWATFLVSLPIHIGLLVGTFGRTIIPGFLLGLGLTPLVLAGAMAGAYLGDHLNRQRLRVVAFWFLAAIAVLSIVGPVLAARGGI